MRKDAEYRDSFPDVLLVYIYIVDIVVIMYKTCRILITVTLSRVLLLYSVMTGLGHTLDDQSLRGAVNVLQPQYHPVHSLDHGYRAGDFHQQLQSREVESLTTC